jgi:cytochrome bd-type quinol oxidase subunit 2
MSPAEKSNTSALFNIASYGAALAFGVMVATLFALERTPHGLSFKLNAAAVISFLVAAPVTFFYWRLIARMATERAPEQRRKKFIVFSVGLLLIGVMAFLYPLKFVPPEKRKDVFIGLALAFGCIGGVGLVMLKVRKFLEADLKHSEEADRRDSES